MAEYGRVAKVALVVSGRMYGGGQRVALDLRKCLQQVDGYTIELWLLGECPETKGLAGVVVDYDGSYNHPLTVLGTVRHLRRLLDQRRPDIVHTHGWDADLLTSLALRGRSAKQVVHLHVLTDWLGSRLWRHAVRRRVARLMLRRAGATVAVSAAVAESWRSALRLDSDAIEVLPNAIDTERYAPTPGGKFILSEPVIGVVSRLVPGKGLEFLVDAFARLRSKGLPARLLVAGEGPLREALMRQADARGLAGAVEWLGQVTDMPAFYRRIDLYVQASLSEGMPLGLLEALASGCPAVATNVGGTAEVMRHGSEGLLVAAADVDALAGAIEEALVDPVKLQEMAAAARQRILDHHTLEVMAAHLGAVYLRVTDGGRLDPVGLRRP